MILSSPVQFHPQIIHNSYILIVTTLCTCICCFVGIDNLITPKQSMLRRSLACAFDSHGKHGKRMPFDVMFVLT